MALQRRLFLLDGMALAYRAHFAFIARPIRTSQGMNTSALFGFVQTLLDIIEHWQPTHLAVAFDTEAPTARHREFPAYKAQREAMPEELSAALPHLRRFIEAFNLRSLALDGYEADDLIGTLVRRAEPAGFESFMVTPDKDFAQLVTERTVLWKPGRQGGDIELLRPAEVCRRWGIARVDQVVDLLGLMGDASDNLPGVPGIGEKTAAKLLAQYGSLEGVLTHAGEVKGKIGEALRQHADQARLCQRLATILTDVPIRVDLEALALGERNAAVLEALCLEFEFNAIGRRLFGEAFKAGRGLERPPATTAPPSVEPPAAANLDLFGHPLDAPAAASGVRSPKSGVRSPKSEVRSPKSGNVPSTLGIATPSSETSDANSGPPDHAGAALRTLAGTPHHYALVDTADKLARLVTRLAAQSAFCFDTETDGLDPQTARLLGIAFSFEAGSGYYVPLNVGTPPGLPAMPSDHEPGGARPLPSRIKVEGATARQEPRPTDPRFRERGAAPAAANVLQTLAPVLADERIAKVGHNLKFDLLVLQWQGIEVRGPLFDTMIAHALIEPEQRHGMDYCSEVYLGYSPVPIERLIGPKGGPQQSLAEVPVAEVAEYSAEDADVTWQLREKFIPLLQERGQERVFYKVEMPVLPAIVAMQFEGIRVDAAVLTGFSAQLAQQMAEHEAAIHRLAGRTFNVNSNKQLGEVLFDELKLLGKPRKTATGQYATDEQTLQALARDHEIVRRLLEYRTVSKLKSTYADALPAAISPRTGRVHTTFHQAATATGRLSSQDPNLQNIPIRTELGQEIRRAFVAREGPDWRLLSADYSQIELRILASMSGETAMREAFERGEDIHTATAARVFGVLPGLVTPEQRRRAKMVNFGIAYGISGFGLAQRLGIPRKEAAEIIDQYFASYPGIRRYMDETIARARERGCVETLTGRRRFLRDIKSANATVRGGAERNAINTPIQGTAADMIKVAMARIHEELRRRGLRTRMLLQVHDELLFDLYRPEEAEVRTLVAEQMKAALPLEVPIEVDIGAGANWLEAH